MKGKQNNIDDRRESLMQLSEPAASLQFTNRSDSKVKKQLKIKMKTIKARSCTEEKLDQIIRHHNETETDITILTETWMNSKL